MTSVTSAEFQKNFGTYKKEALQSPVLISIHGKPTLVLLSKQEFDRISEGGKAASVGETMAGQTTVEAGPEAEPANTEPSITAEQFKALEVRLCAQSGVRFAERPR